MPIFTAGHVVTATEFNAMFPVGAITAWSAAAAPTGWLLCDGSSQLRATYPDLFAVIGVTFGTVDGTHFTLPDLRDRVPLGKGTTHAVIGATGGEETHVLSAGEMPAHTHSGTTSLAGAHSHTYTAPAQTIGTVGSTGTEFTDQSVVNTSTIADHTHTVVVTAAGSGSAHNNLQPYFVVPYIIRF